MKKSIFIFFIFFFIASISVKHTLSAQTEKELLIRVLDKQDKLSEQMVALEKKLTEQMLVKLLTV